MVCDALDRHIDQTDLLAPPLDRCISCHLGACEPPVFLGKDPAHTAPIGRLSPLLDWILSFSLLIGFVAFGVFAHSKSGTVRKKDQRPHQLPWGLIMIGCVFGVFLVIVHLMNIIGVETGPENSMFGRF